MCTGSLVQENSGLANEVAVYAHYLLVAGVVLELTSVVPHEKEAE